MSFSQDPIRTAPIRWTWRATGMLLLVGLVIVAAMAAFIATEPQIPALGPEEFRAARERWDLIAPENYDIEVRVSGRQAATYAVAVRNSTAVRATRDGKPLTQPRTWGTWSVPGMFETMEFDVSQVQATREGRGDETRPGLTLRARFHPEFGFPERYVRLEHSRMGTNPEVAWSVIRFERIESADTAKNMP